MGELAIRAVGLAKTFGGTAALAGVDLEVEAGRVCAVLGRNGAGKTTSVRILTTLIRPDHGRAHVAGFDVERDPQKVRARIGLVGQSTSMDELLSGRDNLEVIGRLYHLGSRRSRERAEELLYRFRLDDAAERLVKTYSGGMRRRLDLAASLLAEPRVLFLDEPTTGLDPVARADMWQAVRDLVAAGTTVLLTTQYLEEADQVADSIVVFDHGRVVASGTPAELKGRVGQGRIRLVLVAAGDATAAAETIEAVVGVSAEINGRTVAADAPAGLDSLAALLGELRRRGLAVEDIGLHRPSLDEVFGHLTRPRPLPYPSGRVTRLARRSGAA